MIEWLIYLGLNDFVSFGCAPEVLGLRRSEAGRFVLVDRGGGRSWDLAGEWGRLWKGRWLVGCCACRTGRPGTGLGCLVAVVLGVIGAGRWLLRLVEACRPKSMALRPTSRGSK